MSRPSPPQPVKLMVSLLTSEQELARKACEELTSKFGPIDFMSEVLPFNFTTYYEEEIGKDLFRRIIGFNKLIAPEILPAVKLRTNELENTFLRKRGSRRINIDPGYIALSHLILATCKPFSHRPYLQNGVYADMTLIFKGGTFRALEWTFPDYRSDMLINVLNKIRAAYYEQLKATDCS